MKKQLTFGEWLRVLFGFPYLLNTNTLEVHFLPDKTKHCWLNLMNPKNRKYLSRSRFKEVLNSGWKGQIVNGCKWCLKKHDTG